MEKDKGYPSYYFRLKSLETLTSVEQKKLGVFSLWFDVYSKFLMEELLSHYNFKRQFALPKYKNYSDFANDELFKASEEFVRSEMPCEWDWIDLVPHDFNNLEKSQVKEIKAHELSNKAQLEKLVWLILSSRGLDQEYMSMDIRFDYPEGSNVNLMNWKNFDDITQLIGRFRWLAYVKDMIEAGAYDKPGEIIPPKRTLSDIALQYFWEGNIITRQNKGAFAQILVSNNIISLKNGNKLYNEYCKYCERSNRVGDQGSDLKNKNHHKKMVMAFSNLKEEKARLTAENEMLEFKKNALNTSENIL